MSPERCLEVSTPLEKQQSGPDNPAGRLHSAALPKWLYLVGDER
jgi:hypothetical protein